MSTVRCGQRRPPARERSRLGAFFCFRSSGNSGNDLAYPHRMGVMRKGLSVWSMGLVDFRSDKERIARSTRIGAHAAKKNARLLRDQNKLLASQSEPDEPVASDKKKPAWQWWNY